MAVLETKPLKLLPSGHHHSHKIIIFSGILISLLIIILAVTIANSRSSFFGRAASTSTMPSIAGNLSLENSYLFASPLSALSDGVSVIRITAFILNDQGLGVTSQKVTLKITKPDFSQVVNALEVNTIQDITDTFGRAIFDLTSKVPGSYTISAGVSNSSLPQTVSVAFR